MRIGLIGYGAINQDVAARIEQELSAKCHLVAVLVRPGRLAHERISTVSEVQRFVDHGLDLVIEAASQEAVREHAVPVLRSGSSLVVTSVGALCDDKLAARMRQAAVEGGARVFLPSCALAGLDRIAAAREGRIDVVKLITRKPPRAWRGTSVENEFSLDAITKPVCVFRGAAREAARLFPQSVNVAAALGLAGVGLDQTTVEIWVDPDCTSNVHQVQAEGEFGRLSFEVSNFPSQNPKTGVVVAMSVIKLLRNLTDPFVVGV